jgi:hypothetical protein
MECVHQARRHQLSVCYPRFLRGAAGQRFRIDDTYSERAAVEMKFKQTPGVFGQGDRFGHGFLLDEYQPPFYPNCGV